MVQWSQDDESRLNLAEYFRHVHQSPRDKRARVRCEKKVGELTRKLRGLQTQRAYQLTEGQKQHLLEARFIGMLLNRSKKEYVDVAASNGVHAIRDVALINKKGRLNPPARVPREQMCFRTNAAGGYRLARWMFEDGQSPDFYRTYVRALQKAQAVRRQQTGCPLATVLYTSDKSNARPVHLIPQPRLHHGKYLEEHRRTNRLLKEAVDKVLADGIKCAKEFGIYLRPQMQSEMLWRMQQNRAAVKQMNGRHRRARNNNYLPFCPWANEDSIDETMDAPNFAPGFRGDGEGDDSAVRTLLDFLAFGQRDAERGLPHESNDNSPQKSLPLAHMEADDGFLPAADVTLNANMAELKERADSGFTPKALSKNRKGVAKGAPSSKNRSRDLMLEDNKLVQALTSAIADNIRRILEQKQSCAEQDPRQNGQDGGGKGKIGKTGKTGKELADQRKKLSAKSRTSAPSSGSKGGKRLPSTQTEPFEILSAAMNKTLLDALPDEANNNTSEMAFTLLEAATAIVRNKDLVSPLLSLICELQPEAPDAQSGARGSNSGSVPMSTSPRTSTTNSPSSRKPLNQRSKGADAGARRSRLDTPPTSRRVKSDTSPTSGRMNLDTSPTSGRVKPDTSAVSHQRRYQRQQAMTRKAKAKSSGSSDVSSTSDDDGTCSCYSGDESTCPSDCLCQSIPSVALVPRNKKCKSRRRRRLVKPNRSYLATSDIFA